MTIIYDLNPGVPGSSDVLLQQCRLLNRLLMAEVQKSFKGFARDALPLLIDGTQQLQRASKQEWNPELNASAMQELHELKALCKMVEQLLRCYQGILSPAQTPMSKDDGDMVP